MVDIPGQLHFFVPCHRASCSSLSPAGYGEIWPERHAALRISRIARQSSVEGLLATIAGIETGYERARRWSGVGALPQNSGGCARLLA